MKNITYYWGLILVLCGVMVLAVPALVNCQSNITLAIGLSGIISGVILHYFLIKYLK